MFEAIRKFRDDLRSGHVLIGAGVTLNDPLVTDALADSVDFLWIDTEHSTMSLETVSCHLLAARAHGVPALVRVPGSMTVTVKHVLDAGACGVIVPQVRNAEEVRRVVADCRYPPVGRRGYGPRVPSNYDRNGDGQYVEAANRNVFVAVQIENIDALTDLDHIAEVAGLDSLVIGPYDLSLSLGITGKIEHPKVLAVVEKIVGKAREVGLAVGAAMGPDSQYAQRLIELGVQWVHVGNDYSFMIHHADRVVAAIRNAHNGMVPRPHVAAGRAFTQS